MLSIKRIALPLILLVSAGTLSAQPKTESERYKAMADKVQVFYNAARYDSIFPLLSPEMKKVMPEKQSVAFFSGLHTHAGRIVRREFVDYKATVAFYKLTFEKAVFSFELALDEHTQINRFLLAPYKDPNLPVLTRNVTPMILPFEGEWGVFWGGDTQAQNYHVAFDAQKGAFDFIVLGEGDKPYKTNGQTNEDYYAFGQPLYAPCDGEVIAALDGVEDNVPGKMNKVQVLGNSVVIKTSKNEYLFFAHFKKGSLKVTKGQKVTQGQLLGLCGNSGHSSQPHLHFHIQNVEDANVATGAKCYFDRLVVNGESKTDYSPVRGDKVQRP